LNILENWRYSAANYCHFTPYSFTLMELYGKEMLSWFFEAKCINLRQFFTLFQYHDQILLLDYNKKKQSVPSIWKRDVDNMAFIDFIYLLLVIYGGDKMSLLQALGKASKLETKKAIDDDYIRHLLPVLLLKKSHEAGPHLYKNEELKLQVECKLEGHNEGGRFYLIGVGPITNLSGEGQVSLDLKDLMILFQEAVEVMEKHGLI
jgi:hypothetical protein